MPRLYVHGVRPSPSGLACILCGRTESSSWRGVDSRWCARKGCKEAALADARSEAACNTCEELPAKAQLAVQPARLLPADTTISDPVVRGDMLGDMPFAFAVPLTTPVDVPMAKPPVAITAAVAKPKFVLVPVPAPAPLATQPVATATSSAAAPPPLPLATRQPTIATSCDELPASGAPPAQSQKRREASRPLPPAKRKPLAAVSGNSPRLVPYEVERLARIARNKEKLRELGLDDNPRLCDDARRREKVAARPRPPKPTPPTTTRTLRSAVVAVADQREQREQRPSLPWVVNRWGP